MGASHSRHSPGGGVSFGSSASQFLLKVASFGPRRLRHRGFPIALPTPKLDLPPGHKGQPPWVLSEWGGGIPFPQEGGEPSSPVFLPEKKIGICKENPKLRLRPLFLKDRPKHP